MTDANLVRDVGPWMAVVILLVVRVLPGVTQQIAAGARAVIDGRIDVTASLTAALTSQLEAKDGHITQLESARIAELTSLSAVRDTLVLIHDTLGIVVRNQDRYDKRFDALKSIIMKGKLQ